MDNRRIAIVAASMGLAHAASDSSGFVDDFEYAQKVEEPSPLWGDPHMNKNSRYKFRDTKSYPTDRYRKTKRSMQKKSRKLNRKG